MSCYNFCSDEIVRLETIENTLCVKKQKKQLTKKEEIQVKWKNVLFFINKERETPKLISKGNNNTFS